MQAKPFNYGHDDILSENRKYLLDGSTPVDSTLSSFFPSMLCNSLNDTIFTKITRLQNEPSSIISSSRKSITYRYLYPSSIQNVCHRRVRLTA